MSVVQLPISIQLGFMTIFQENNTTLGGYLVTNSWGRPIEFRMSSGVQPNRMHQILYANTLQEYLHADLIGKALLDKSSSAVHLLFTDSLGTLSLRSRVNFPVVAIWDAGDNRGQEFDRVTYKHLSTPGFNQTMVMDPGFAEEEDTVLAILQRLDKAFDLTEPFQRIREAMGEARKMGVANRA